MTRLHVWDFCFAEGRQRTVVQSNITYTERKTMNQHRITDTKRLNRETNKGNEGDTGGATETMIS